MSGAGGDVGWWLATLAPRLVTASPPSPGPITRDGAAAAARAELSKGAYHHDGRPLPARALHWLITHAQHLLDSATRHAPGKGVGLLAIVVIVAVVVALVAIKVGGVRRSTKAPKPILDDELATPADHRERARAFALEQRWAHAVREWLRATARELEERGVLDPRPGRTAAELCAEASARLPGIADDLRAATSAFDAIWYGGRAAAASDEAVLRRLDERVAGSHRALAGRL